MEVCNEKREHTAKGPLDHGGNGASPHSAVTEMVNAAVMLTMSNEETQWKSIFAGRRTQWFWTPKLVENINRSVTTLKEEKKQRDKEPQNRI